MLLPDYVVHEIRLRHQGTTEWWAICRELSTRRRPTMRRRCCIAVCLISKESSGDVTLDIQNLSSSFPVWVSKCLNDSGISITPSFLILSDNACRSSLGPGRMCLSKPVLAGKTKKSIASEVSTCNSFSHF